jgi:hypothetical protein
VNPLKEPIEVPEWLESEYREIDDLIESLRVSKDLLVSFRSSPVDVLTRTAVDLLVKLKKAYYEESPLSGDPNPVIIFDERFSDPLGNVAQREFNRYSLRVWSPPMEKFLFHLAVFFSRSLSKDFQFQKDFHDLLKNLKEFLPPVPIGKESKNAEKTNKNVNIHKANNISGYYRRRSKGK